MSKVEGSADTLTAEAGGQGGNGMEMPAELRELSNYSHSC